VNCETHSPFDRLRAEMRVWLGTAAEVEAEVEVEVEH
jgi:hypothetical protein